LTTEFIRGIENYTRSDDRPAIATVGTFDGIHRGHREIFNRVREQSIAEDTRAVLITFHPHPRVVVTPNSVPLLLTTVEEKTKFVPDFFDGKVLVLDFDRRMMAMPAEQFVSDILIDTVGIKKLIVGYDHALGRNREGDIPFLRRMGEKYGFEVEVVGPVMDDGNPISSSRIRRALTENRFEEAVRLLGHAYAIYGTVERGIGLGKKLGYPTANVRYSERKLLPHEGVYACRAQVGGEHKDGMMFIGRNHFNPAGGVSVEANLFDFDRDIYDEEMVVYPFRWIRENHRFESKEALVEQIGKDKEAVVNILKEEKRNASAQGAKSSHYC
jgi:riboflavin kinase/FMN adenylyltransferase